MINQNNLRRQIPETLLALFFRSEKKRKTLKTFNNEDEENNI